MRDVLKVVRNPKVAGGVAGLNASRRCGLVTKQDTIAQPVLSKRLLKLCLWHTVSCVCLEYAYILEFWGQQNNV